MTAKPGRLLVTNIGRLLTMVPRPGDPLGVIEDAVVLIRGGTIAWAGPRARTNRTSANVFAVEDSPIETLDAGGALVTPGLVEPHAHPIFAGSRAAEFDLRARGATYLEIQAAGGGIRSTVRSTRAASDDELLALTRARLDGLLAHGVTVCEAKSGYSLDIEGELRLLRILARAAESHPIDLSPTLLAHVLPPEVTTDAERAAYIDRFIAEAIPAVADRPHAGARPLAEAVDVFCDRGAFTLDETRRILEAARDHGLALRVHAEQLSHTGAADLAAALGARSVEHLECLADRTIPRLAAAGTVCTLLPGAALTLRLPFPDARRLLDGGCAVALGTDLNPGSSYTDDLPLMMSIACMQMGMSCAEAWQATTIVAARAAGRPASGHLAPGARGDLVLWTLSDEREILQRFGGGSVGRVVVRGRVAFSSRP